MEGKANLTEGREMEIEVTRRDANEAWKRMSKKAWRKAYDAGRRSGDGLIKLTALEAEELRAWWVYNDGDPRRDFGYVHFYTHPEVEGLCCEYLTPGKQYICRVD